MDLLAVSYYPDGWVYWSLNNQDPYCSICLKEDKKVTILEKNDVSNEKGYWFCKIHKKHFHTLNLKNPFI